MNDLMVIFPVYNERDAIQSVLHAWKKTLDSLSIAYQLMVCEDGSTDGTAQLLSQIALQYRLILNQKKERRGYGQSIIDGLKSANSHYVFCVDADGQYQASDFKKIWAKRHEAQIIRGVRIRRADEIARKIFSQLFKLFFKLLFASSLSDPSSSFILFKSKTIAPYINYLSYMREGFWWGFSALCVSKKISSIDILIHHQKRLSGKTRVYKMGKIIPIVWRNAIGLLRLKYDLWKK